MFGAVGVIERLHGGVWNDVCCCVFWFCPGSGKLTRIGRIAHSHGHWFLGSGSVHRYGDIFRLWRGIEYKPMHSASISAVAEVK